MIRARSSLSQPFLDRFGISVPISMPKSQDLAIILGGHDEKLGGYDELVQVPEILTEDQLLSIWYEIGAIPWRSGSQRLYSCHSSGIHLMCACG